MTPKWAPCDSQLKINYQLINMKTKNQSATIDLHCRFMSKEPMQQETPGHLTCQFFETGRNKHNILSEQ